MSTTHPSPHGLGSSVQEGHTEPEEVDDVEKSGFQTQRCSAHMNSDFDSTHNTYTCLSQSKIQHMGVRWAQQLSPSWGGVGIWWLPGEGKYGFQRNNTFWPHSRAGPTCRRIWSVGNALGGSLFWGGVEERDREHDVGWSGRCRRNWGKGDYAHSSLCEIPKH